MLGFQAEVSSSMEPPSRQTKGAAVASRSLGLALTLADAAERRSLKESEAESLDVDEGAECPGRTRNLALTSLDVAERHRRNEGCAAGRGDGVNLEDVIQADVDKPGGVR